jgi:16S rRNA (guanine527-N7)-methyltransferase
MAAMRPDISGPAALADILPVSRETGERLARFVALVEKWQKAENLIAGSTLREIWRRHVADSAQLVPLFPAATHWLDLGSGGGFPGIVIAILVADRPGATVHLVESNSRKCAFLRAAARETGAPAVVHQGRIDDVLSGWNRPVDVITARALAPLCDLLRMTGALIGPDRPAAFAKGVDFRREVAEAAESFDLDLVEHPSRVAEGSVILEVRRAAPRSGATPSP